MPDDPTLDSKGFVSELAVAAAELFVAAVLPSTDTRFFALADREAKSGGIVLGVPSRKRIEQATDKSLLPELTTSVGLRTLPTRKVVRDDKEAVGAFGFPALVKPRRTTWIRGPEATMLAYYPARYISDKQAAKKALEAP